eukprot:scaffold9903_cov106-Isochrysis_galbana.AAC.4
MRTPSPPPLLGSHRAKGRQGSAPPGNRPGRRRPWRVGRRGKHQHPRPQPAARHRRRIRRRPHRQSVWVCRSGFRGSRCRRHPPARGRPSLILPCELCACACACCASVQSPCHIPVPHTGTAALAARRRQRGRGLHL